MTEFGYTMMCEQYAADQLVADPLMAEEAGFEFSVISDHYQPWLASQGTRHTCGRFLAPRPRPRGESA